MSSHEPALRSTPPPPPLPDDVSLSVALDSSTANGVSAPVPDPSGRWKKLAAFRQRHAVAEEVSFFVLGFLFDVVTLGRIDDAVSLIQQAAYLSLLAGLLLFEERCRLVGPPMKGFGAKLWTVSEGALHFLFGSLLSTSTLFFFKSASGLTALAFLAVMLGLLVANELPRFRKLGPVVRLALFAFCLTAYLSYLLPILAGFLSAWLFLGAVGCAALPLYLLFARVRAWSGDEKVALRRAGIPMGAVLVMLVGLYFLGAIPPVPLSVQEMGVYHQVEKRDGNYLLSRQVVDWSPSHLWNREFLSRPGDKLYVFVRIFAPSRFKDKVYVRFSYDDPRAGWMRTDRIPLLISGGREEGFRGYATKGNYAPGNWRVAVETEDGRIVGVMRFHVAADSSTGERTFFAEQG